VAEGTLHLELCAPEKPHATLDVAEVTIPGAGGVFTVHPGHTPLLSTLIPGVLVATGADGSEHFFAVHGGFAEVKPEKVVILADFYEPQDDIDAERAGEAESRAQNRLQKPPEDMDWERAERALSRAMARIQASNKRGYQ
jgi:F-type H+-transporting ATPase subunit epsilon